MAEQRRTGVFDKCITCSGDVKGDRARAETRFPELEEYSGKFLCRTCRRRVADKYEKPAGDDWDEAQQRFAFAEMRKIKGYYSKVDSVEEEEEEEEE
ncbi:hypothetical protein LTR17_010911 [Elasticomyces elasticus]|nr:hypothetical protein LTR17_010911 [Elasticomyces elasticus]